MWFYNRYSHLSGIFNFWPKLTIFAWAIAHLFDDFWPFSKCSRYFTVWCFLTRFFCTQPLQCGRRIIFRTFFAFLNFDPNWPFCMGYSPSFWPILAIFKMLSFFYYKVSFYAVFCTQPNQCGRTIIFRSFFAFLNFDPSWPFCKGYNPCFWPILAIFKMLSFFEY